MHCSPVDALCCQLCASHNPQFFFDTLLHSNDAMRTPNHCNGTTTNPKHASQQMDQDVELNGLSVMLHAAMNDSAGLYDAADCGIALSLLAAACASSCQVLPYILVDVSARNANLRMLLHIVQDHWHGLQQAFSSGW